MRKLLFAAAVGLLIWAALVVPLPFALLEPIPAMSITEVVDLEDGSAGELPEDVLFTVVQVGQPTSVGSVQALFDDERDLRFIQTVVPPGIDPERFAEFQRRLFRESVRAAAAAGQEAAGREVNVSGEGARVVSTVPGTPADGVLEQEDVITAVDGREISLASELASAVSDREAGDTVELTFRRDDEQRTETVQLAPLSQLSEVGEVGLGVVVATVDLQIEVPVDAEPTADARIGGPSAGLMIAIGVYDAVTEDDLVGERIVAGTGTMDLSGNVGAVGGIPEKVRGAVLADAEIFLVPESQAEAAREAAPEGLEVIAVSSLQEAIDALSE